MDAVTGSVSPSRSGLDPDAHTFQEGRPCAARDAQHGGQALDEPSSSGHSFGDLQPAPEYVSEHSSSRSMSKPESNRYRAEIKGPWENKSNSSGDSSPALAAAKSWGQPAGANKAFVRTRGSKDLGLELEQDGDDAGSSSRRASGSVSLDTLVHEIESEIVRSQSGSMNLKRTGSDPAKTSSVPPGLPKMPVNAVQIERLVPAERMELRNDESWLLGAPLLANKSSSIEANVSFDLRDASGNLQDLCEDLRQDLRPIQESQSESPNSEDRELKASGAESELQLDAQVTASVESVDAEGSRPVAWRSESKEQSQGASSHMYEEEDDDEIPDELRFGSDPPSPTSGSDGVASFHMHFRQSSSKNSAVPREIRALVFGTDAGSERVNTAPTDGPESESSGGSNSSHHDDLRAKSAPVPQEGGNAPSWMRLADESIAPQNPALAHDRQSSSQDTDGQRFSPGMASGMDAASESLSDPMRSRDSEGAIKVSSMSDVRTKPKRGAENTNLKTAADAFFGKEKIAPVSGTGQNKVESPRREKGRKIVFDLGVGGAAVGKDKDFTSGARISDAGSRSTLAKEKSSRKEKGTGNNQKSMSRFAQSALPGVPAASPDSSVNTSVFSSNDTVLEDFARFGRTISGREAKTSGSGTSSGSPAANTSSSLQGISSTASGGGSGGVTNFGFGNIMRGKTKRHQRKKSLDEAMLARVGSYSNPTQSGSHSPVSDLPRKSVESGSGSQKDVTSVLTSNTRSASRQASEGTATSSMPSSSGTSGAPVAARAAPFSEFAMGVGGELAQLDPIKYESYVKGKSFLECVVRCLSGFCATRRKSLFRTMDVCVWLEEDLEELRWKPLHGPSPTGRGGEVLPLDACTRLRGQGVDVGLDYGGKGAESLDLTFQSKEDGRTLFSGLCCLVPEGVRIGSMLRGVSADVSRYNLFLDSYKDKPVCHRKAIDRYIMLTTLGRGSFGKVKLAIDTTSKLFRAIKVIPKVVIRKQMRAMSGGGAAKLNMGGAGGSPPGDLANQFGSVADMREIAIMSKLSHNNILRLFEVFDDEVSDKLYIVLEYMAGGVVMKSNLLEGETPLSEDRAREVFIDALAGLEYLHQRQIIHRDIKPDNLLAKADGTVKIADFGTAKVIGIRDADGNVLQTTKTNCGTPAFTAPELCISENAPDGPTETYPADIWSLGITLYYMLFGRVPFVASNVFRMYGAVCNDKLLFPDAPVVSPAVKELLKRILVKNPYKRPSFEEMWSHPWTIEGLRLAHAERPTNAQQDIFKLTEEDLGNHKGSSDLSSSFYKNNGSVGWAKPAGPLIRGHTNLNCIEPG
ncbi:Serine/threonine-protein kinase ssp1 [Porphyridium purpureum]|uniref:Serine/threonine-protein kinase ssp1 n=1 Tax=Porphyridium purpureum TaxID=35688 RepID=A0A5J4YTC2_PORPP|nr:Serine/threonine-protein kinase ssp1 [Porphyridium purpureum]|eukprot:POR2225..scf227_4